MDNRSLFFRAPTKGVDSLHSRPHSLCHLFRSPQAENFKTQLLGSCFLEPLLCMSRITLIHSDHWLLRTSLGEFPSGRCPLLAACQRGRGKKDSTQELLYLVKGQTWKCGSQYGVVSMVGFENKKATCISRLDKSGPLIPFLTVDSS